MISMHSSITARSTRSNDPPRLHRALASRRLHRRADGRAMAEAEKRVRLDKEFNG